LALLLERETQTLPHPVCADEQHRLFEQFPLVHWLLLWQVPPFATWVTQEPPVQYLPEAHETTVLAVHAPAPLHVEAVFTARSVLQVAALQVVSLPAYVHWLGIPPHAPAQVACVAVHAARDPRGAPLTVTHVPTLFASAQAWHWPVQAPSQHTPSTQ
jgi:hypothetical protein